MDNLNNKQNLEKARIRRKTLKKKKRIRKIERAKEKMNEYKQGKISEKNILEWLEKNN